MGFFADLQVVDFHRAILSLSNVGQLPNGRNGDRHATDGESAEILRIKAEMLARSGIEVAKMQLLLHDKSPTDAGSDALNQAWAFFKAGFRAGWLHAGGADE